MALAIRELLIGLLRLGLDTAGALFRQPPPAEVPRRCVPFNLLGEIVHLFRAHIDAGLLEALLEHMAHLVFNVSQVDLVLNFVGNAFGTLDVSRRNIIVINRDIWGIAVSHTSWLRWRAGRSITPPKRKRTTAAGARRLYARTASPNARRLRPKPQRRLH
ncbi:hypothetical protein [Pseudarthrobacter sp. L1SW]|uniref:hypothetical protein n=1 Tax=Pseudarthrobacter sp. L1SW TaxID=2851598 RepID=UPI001E30FF48|nr:hypothetical protein [Pseudarthrobacter sp. L1SW]UEL28108.1 hypothetical protein KTR40_16285 [Pseudarthrobacter sp. L1SW]